ncbi:response regulator transcription factor [Massilia sp. YIM B02763]|uniref:response regulator transcription factor n=1 Tax=Massilia sp. YIM B02763 TaxID=3050130 RepID=UPI0025B675DD|nr:response regulator transcription factor [Massilia sp. YIM B02763]MDN4052042.1 response regulator transcription factor [Massilia sp. YIM B02763]
MLERVDAGACRIRVAIADDHPLMRVGVAHCLAAQGGFDIVAVSDGGAGAVACFDAHRPDVSILAPRVAGADGFGELHAIRRVQADARVVVLADSGGTVRMRVAHGAGAAAYLLKTADGPKLAAAIRDVHAGVDPLGDALRDATPTGDPRTLSMRELDVLREVARGRSNRAIGDLLCIGETTVKSHLGAVLDKLGASNRAHAVALGISHGMISPAAAEST